MEAKSSDNNTLQELYQKLYFHELEMKEKIITRLQITFGLLATILTIIAYMLRTTDYNSSLIALNLFYIFIFICLVPLSFSSYYAIKAFWGNTYETLPLATETEEFHEAVKKHELDMAEYIKAYPNTNEARTDYSSEKAISDYLYKYYAECSSHNSEINRQRALKNHLAIKNILLAAIPLLFATFLFIAFDLDSSSPRKALLVEDKNLSTTLKNIKDSYTPKETRNEQPNNTIKRSNQRRIKMQDDDKKNPPPPPPAPEPPEIRPLVEDDKGSMDANSTIINEDN